MIFSIYNMQLSDIADKETERYNRVSIIFSIYNMPLSDIADKDTERYNRE